MIRKPGEMPTEVLTFTMEEVNIIQLVLSDMMTYLRRDTSIPDEDVGELIAEKVELLRTIKDQLK